MNCSEAMELISSRLDGALSPAEEDALQAHLAQCASCRSVQAELSQLNSDLAALSCEPPQALHARVMREVRQKSRRKKDQRAVLRFVGAMAAAAALLAVLAGSHLLSLPGFGDDTMVSMIGVSIARPEKEKSPLQQAEEAAAALAEETGCRVLVALGYAPALEAEAEALPQGMALYKMSREELDALEKELSGAYELSVFDAPGAQTQGYLLCVDES